MIDCGQKQVFDNIDYEQHVDHMRVKIIRTLCISGHCVENRVPGIHLSNEKPQGILKDMENGKLISNRMEHLEQLNNYKLLVSKILMQYIPFLNFIKYLLLLMLLSEFLFP